jgi:pantoate--beta-alanine ligase
MQVCKTVVEMRTARRDAKRTGVLGLVPTMGALHEGHLSLVLAARSRCEVVAVSIFVNPLQFGPTEDFAKYPRNFEQDAAMLERAGVDLIFAPSTDEMYPQDTTTYVTVEGLSDRLCGRSRPGHFRGVTTVVSKLFHIIEPDFAFFGQKDAAQLAIIRKMARDMNFPTEIVGCPIVREVDGLAMSSRNRYLSADQRRTALVLHCSLVRVNSLYEKGQRKAADLISAAREVFATEPLARLEYFEIVDAETLEPQPDAAPGALVVVAASVGSTRLIDNIVLT